MRILIIAVIVLLTMVGLAAGADTLCQKNCTADDRGFGLIRDFEGYSPFTYRDIAGVPTIGFGHAIRPGEKFSEPLMGPAAETLLERDVSATVREINQLVRIPLFSCQFDALTSFTYNLGAGTLKKSPVLKLVNAGRHERVPAELLKYDKARVAGIERVIPGLFNRRKSEAKLYGEAP